MSSGAYAGAAGWDRGGGPTLADCGEAILLGRLLQLAGRQERLLLGPGDDAAVWRPASGNEVVLSQDATVEGVDFVRRWSVPYDVGRRALAVAVSDLAAMGASPAWCQTTLCAPGDTLLADVVELQRGIVDAAARFGCAVAGGDVSDTAGPLVIDVAVGGEVHLDEILRRDAGRPGDILLVTGSVGGAAMGLAMLRDGLGAAAPEVVRNGWLRRLLLPEPRLAEGGWLAKHGVRCGGDCSDGLRADIERTALASGCGAEIWLDAVPFDAGLPEFAGDRAVELALGGGDDFELLAAASPGAARALLAGWPSHLTPLHRIGRLREGAGLGLLEREDGPDLPLPAATSHHWA